MATLKDFERVLAEALAQIPRLLGNEAIRFFQSQMKKEEDVNGNAYARRGFERDLQRGKRILNNRGDLFDAIEILSIDKDGVTVGVDDKILAYATIHNEGGKIKVTAKMKKFFFAKSRFFEVAREDMNDDEDFYFNMALKPVGSEMDIPKREYVGKSELLEAHLEKAVEAFLNAKLKQV